MQNVKNKVQDVLDIMEFIAALIEALQAAIAAAVAQGGGLYVVPFRRDAQGVDHPELCESVTEAHTWANAQMTACEEAEQEDN